MLVKVCLLVLLAAVTMSAPIEEGPLTLDEQWVNFKADHKKSYESPEEDAKRFEIFKDNVKRIEEHNKKFDAGEVTFKQGVNAFADLTHEEFAKTHLMKVKPEGKRTGLVGSH